LEERASRREEFAAFDCASKGGDVGAETNAGVARSSPDR
jgi:hypothetical protein